MPRAYHPLEIAAGAHLEKEHEELEAVPITVEHRSHQLLDGIGPTLGLFDSRLHLGGRLDPLAKQQLEEESFLAVKVVIERRFRESEFVGHGRKRETCQTASKDDIAGRVKNLGPGLIPPTLVPCLSFGAGSTIFG